jgi:serine/threonine protein kinase
MDTGLLPPQSLLKNRYAILRKLAQGGQSAVYLARDTYMDNAERAIKEMSESQIEPEKRQQAINDFMREAQLLFSLDHPALARVSDFFMHETRYFLVMEYVPGHNLEDEMVAYRQEPLDWEDVTIWGMALTDVLAYLHGQNPAIIYRDLKPANVMLMPDGRVKLIDFGIARRLHPNRLADTMQLGTDGYAPLEQYSSRSEPRSDIYALGASLYHLLTGRVPEAAPLRIAGQPLTAIRALNRKVPEPVERVVQMALNLYADDRFQTAQEMRSALEWARQHSGPARGPDSRRDMSGGANGSNMTSGPGYSPQPNLHQGVQPAPALDGTYPGRAGYSGGYPGGSPQAHHQRAYSAPPPLAARVNPAQTTDPGALRRTTMPAQQTTHPRLSVRPLRLDAGYVLVGQIVTMELEIYNRGGGALKGYAETNIAAMTVHPQEIDETTTRLGVQVDATGLAIGPYVCHIAVRTNGGDLIIQVRFVVRPTNDPYLGYGR